MDSFKCYDGFATDRHQLDRLRLPKDAVEPETVAQFHVLPSMLDHTNHVNNAEYVRWIFDTLPQGSHIPTPYHLCLEYQQETQPNELVTIRRISTPGTIYFQISNPRSTAVLATLSY